MVSPPALADIVTRPRFAPHHPPCIDNLRYMLYHPHMNTLRRGTIHLLPIQEDDCCAPARPPGLPADRAALAARRFKALADTTRLGILATLAAADNPVCACDLGDDVALGQPTVAHHLKVLRDTGLIVAERRGKWAHYQLHPAAADWVRATLAALPDAPTGGGR